MLHGFFNSYKIGLIGHTQLSVVVGVNIVCWSGGKDSTATIIVAKKLGIPIDYILFSEVMFDETISCELPEHMEFVKTAAIPKFKEWGYETKILHHNKTYMDYFNHVRKKGKYKGKKVGFPMADKCNARVCKIAPIEKFLKSLKKENEITQFVGICADEPIRLQRLSDDKRSLLAEQGITESMARDICMQYGLLSPYYTYSKRGGCFCCPNAGKKQLAFIRTHHKALWNKLLLLEQEDNLIGNIFNTKTGVSIKTLEEEFLWDDRQLSLFDFL